MVVAFGTVGKRIVAVGINSFCDSSRRQRDLARRTRNPERVYDHAEVRLLARLGSRHCTSVWVLRLLRDGRSGLAKPCEVCQLALRQQGIKHVWYSEDSQKDC